MKIFLAKNCELLHLRDICTFLINNLLTFRKFRVNRNKLIAETVRKNTVYGGYNPAATNVYYTHGKIDPWRTMGINYGNSIVSSPVDVVSSNFEFSNDNV